MLRLARFKGINFSGVAGAVVLHAAWLAGTASDVMGCPYLTRDLEERSGGVTRLNTYQPGSWVCHKGVMHICGSNGRWKPRGPCTGYQNWERTLACRIEGTKVDACAPKARSDRGKGDGARGDGSKKQDRSSGGENRNISGNSSAGSQTSGRQTGGGSSAPRGKRPGGGGAANVPNWARPPGGPSQAGNSGPRSDVAAGGSGGPQRGGNNPNNNRVTGACATEQRRIELEMKSTQQKLASSGRTGVCGLSRIARRMADRLDQFYRKCPTADPSGGMQQYARKLREWARTAASQSCS